MTQIVLHGELGKEFGKEYNLSIHSPIEGIRALSAMVPNFKERFAEGNYYIYTGTGKNKTNLDEDTVCLRTTDTIHIVPAVAGAKKKGMGKLLVGIALIGVAFIPGLNTAVFGALGGLAGSMGSAGGVVAAKAVSSVAAKAIFMGGLTLAMGGAAQMMAPKVGEQKESTLFGGTPDSVEEGTPVPLVYGQYLAVGYPVTFELVSGMNAYSGYDGIYNGGGYGGIGGGYTGGWDNIIEQQV